MNNWCGIYSKPKTFVRMVSGTCFSGSSLNCTFREFFHSEKFESAHLVLASVLFGTYFFASAPSAHSSKNSHRWEHFLERLRRLLLDGGEDNGPEPPFPGFARCSTRRFLVSGVASGEHGSKSVQSSIPNEKRSLERATAEAKETQPARRSRPPFFLPV